ncbi:putative multidrug resistance ABC transporter ATP-binding/permease protein YheH [Vibrio stylophorae]|uniref:Multidrug resistance ABC transporter ATP-binding/permease protein YheH n=1 Tax=Vibrio stylophorae TaxID=659351 RepID=A0ABN8DZB6_9VIBR|nr:ABC transporter ATP-binding protein [Vibrio stylophorae]CAH0535795.1 putative multidrug resistance ABC transporter ATP-binding/permease protein YheH [Vibrio stylophorae]
MTDKTSNTAKQSAAFVRLLRYTRAHQMHLAMAFALLAIAISAEMAIPWLAKIIIDDFIVPQHFDWVHLLWLCGAMFGLYVVQFGFQYLQGFAFRRSALFVVKDVRHALFAHLLKLPMAMFDQNRTGRLVSYVTHDTEALRDLFVSTLPTMIQGSLRITAIFIAIAILDWHLMMLTLLLIPVLLLVMQGYRKLSAPVLNGVRIQLSHIHHRISESLQGMALIQAFGQTQQFNEKFRQNNDAWFAFRTRAIAIDSLMLLPLTRLIGALTTFAIVAWFGAASLKAAIEIGTLYAFLNYIERFFDPFRQLSMELRKMQVALVSSAQIFELLDTPAEPIHALVHAQEHEPEQQHKQTPANHRLHQQNLPAFSDAPFDTPKAAIAFRNVHLRYPDGTLALDDVSFTVNQGEFTAIVGQSGSGKSSIINLLMRFYPHQQGDVLLEGESIETLSNRQLSQMMGLVSQLPHLFSGTIQDNIALSDTCTDERAQRAAQSIDASRFIERLSQGYQHPIHHGGGALSMGEKQLIALARVLAHDPKVYLLDEATAHLDSETEEVVKRALASIPQGRTVIAVAHRLSTIRHAQQILVMDKGKIVQRGTHNQLVAEAGAYQTLYLAQQEQAQHQSENAHLGLLAS